MSLSGLDAGVAVLSPFCRASRLEEVRARDTVRDDPSDAPVDASGFSAVQFGSVVYFGVLISGAQPISTIRARRLR
jgi:hypothetical protein